MIIGIDFGTCYSSVAIMADSEPNTTFFKDQTQLGIPSKFLYHDGKKYFGIECDAVKLNEFREDIIEEIKKKVREDSKNLDKAYNSGGKRFYLKGIIDKFFKYLIEHAKEDGRSLLGSAQEIEEITITYPVGIENGNTATTTYNGLLEDIISNITHLPENKIHLLDEPSAAAMSYLYRQNLQKNYEKDQKILVFDLGGGTFDLSYVIFHPISLKFEIRGRDGDLNLGGGDWDDALEQHICKKYNISIPCDHKKQFRDKIIKLKIELSNNETAMLLYDRGNLQEIAEIDRKEFEKVTKSILDRAIRKMGDFMDENDIDPTDLDKIVLVGGSSNMPQIKKGIHERFPTINKDQIELFSPSTAVSMGAALYSKILNQTEDGALCRFEGTAPHTYGIRLFDPEDKRFKILNVIFKGDRFEYGTIHAEPQYTIIPPSCDRTRIRIRIFESDAKKKNGPDGDLMEESEDVRFNGLVAYHAVPQEYLRDNKKYQVRIELDLTLNNVLKITFVDIRTKKKYSGELCQEDD